MTNNVTKALRHYTKLIALLKAVVAISAGINLQFLKASRPRFWAL